MACSHPSLNTRADQAAVGSAGVSVPPCYAGCELLELRAPGFQGQLSGDTECELMLMKAARPCKQHGRMSLEYITIHNCLPRAGGLHMVQPCLIIPRANTHTNTRHTLSQPTWTAHRSDRPKSRQLLGWRTQDLELSRTDSEVCSRHSWFLDCFIMTSLFSLTSYLSVSNSLPLPLHHKCLEDGIQTV